jgi:hypothetical protein
MERNIYGHISLCKRQRSAFKKQRLLILEIVNNYTRERYVDWRIFTRTVILNYHPVVLQLNLKEIDSEGVGLSPVVKSCGHITGPSRFDRDVQVFINLNTISFSKTTLLYDIKSITSMVSYLHNVEISKTYFVSNCIPVPQVFLRLS